MGSVSDKVLSKSSVHKPNLYIPPYILANPKSPDDIVQIQDNSLPPIAEKSASAETINPDAGSIIRLGYIGFPPSSALVKAVVEDGL